MQQIQQMQNTRNCTWHLILIFCSGCSFWVHKKCSDIPGRLVEDPHFRCRRCLGNAQAIDGRPCIEFQLANDKLDVVGNFICLSGGCEIVTIKRCHSAWDSLENCYPCLLVKQFF